MYPVRTTSVPTVSNYFSIYNLLCQLYYHNSHGAIVVFDMTRPGTLYSASIWKEELSRHLVGDDAIPALLVGNKVFIEYIALCIATSKHTLVAYCKY